MIDRMAVRDDLDKAFLTEFLMQLRRDHLCQHSQRWVATRVPSE
jgi:hypothetical protein